MELPGLTHLETHKLQRSISKHDQGFKRELSPIGAAKLIQKTLDHDCKMKDLQLALSITGPTIIYQHLKILNNLDPKLHKFVKYNEELKIGDLVYDRAHVIAGWEKNHQNEIFPHILEMNLTRKDLRGIMQRVERGKVSVNTAVKEVKEEKGRNIIVSFIGVFRNKGFTEKLRKLNDSKLTKLSEKIEKNHEINKLIKSSGKKLLNTKISSDMYIHIISGDKFPKEISNKLENITEKLIANELK